MAEKTEFDRIFYSEITTSRRSRSSLTTVRHHLRSQDISGSTADEHSKGANQLSDTKLKYELEALRGIGA
jgi:hypothetical protein